MAEGYARASGKPGVVLVTSGPGATNVITPIQDALSDGTPLVVFCGQVPTSAIGSDAFQEADVIGISRGETRSLNSPPPAKTSFFPHPFYPFPCGPSPQSTRFHHKTDFPLESLHQMEHNGQDRG